MRSLLSCTEALRPLRALLPALGLTLCSLAAAAETADSEPAAKAPATKASAQADLAARIKAGVELNNQSGKKGKAGSGSTYIEVKVPPAPMSRRAPGAIPNPVDMRRGGGAKAVSSRDELAARAAALASSVESEEKSQAMPMVSRPWDYEGESGPSAWGKLKPEYSTCDLGQRQSPIHILASDALTGPAEPLQLNYLPTSGSVVNTGHTIQVDLDPANPDTLTVRGSSYRLVQIQFHHPAETQIDARSFAMEVQLLHRNDKNQLAVLSILMDPGPANAMINKVWTYMPLDTQDRVAMPPGSLDILPLLPQDRRYYMYMGSLSTPPCTEGVLWLVLKNQVNLSQDQLRLFTKQFPNNARPAQALNGRVVREAQ